MCVCVYTILLAVRPTLSPSDIPSSSPIPSLPSQVPTLSPTVISLTESPTQTLNQNTSTFSPTFFPTFSPTQTNYIFVWIQLHLYNCTQDCFTLQILGARDQKIYSYQTDNDDGYYVVIIDPYSGVLENVYYYQNVSDMVNKDDLSQEESPSIVGVISLNPIFENNNNVSSQLKDILLNIGAHEPYPFSNPNIIGWVLLNRIGLPINDEQWNLQNFSYINTNKTNKTYFSDGCLNCVILNITAAIPLMYRNTESPTITPITSSPTTDSPTVFPSFFPTFIPSQSPSMQPTMNVPSLSPITTNPTTSPIILVKNYIIRIPIRLVSDSHSNTIVDKIVQNNDINISLVCDTNAPTNAPTFAPTFAPTNAPTNNKEITEEPTLHPITGVPTQSPVDSAESSDDRIWGYTSDVCNTRDSEDPTLVVTLNTLEDPDDFNRDYCKKCIKLSF